MHRGQHSGNYNNSLDDLDRELALLRQKRELLEGQQNQLRGGRGRGQGGGHGGRGPHGGGGGNVHPISPWDNNAPIRPLFNNSSDFHPQNSGNGFNYSNMYEESPRDQFRPPPPRRNDNRKRVESNNWSDRSNNIQVRQPPRKRSRPNPPAEQQRSQSGPRVPSNAGPERNRSSYRANQRPNKNNHPNSAPYNPPDKAYNQTNKPAPTFGNEDILRANTEPNAKVRGRLEHALGVILQKMKSSYPEKEALFHLPLPCKTIKQMLRDRIKGLLINKQVGVPTEIVRVYRETFTHDDDIINSVDTLISTTAQKVASKLDKKVKSENKPAEASAAVVAKRSDNKTKPNSGATAVKPSQTQPKPARPAHDANPKRHPEADVILSHFKENMSWAIDAELKLMFDNLKDLYKEQSSTDENIRDAIKKLVTLQRARFEEELNKPIDTAEIEDNTKQADDVTKQDDVPVDANKTTEADNNETSDDKEPKSAENGEVAAENGAVEADQVQNPAENDQNLAETDKNQAANDVQAENGPEKIAEVAKDQQEVPKQAKFNKTAAEIHKLCHYVLGIWLHRQLPVVLPRFRENLAKMVRASLLDRVQEESGNKEVPIPARVAAHSTEQQQRYYVSLVGKPKLPKRPKLSAFLWRFNPCSVKRHKSIFNLMFVGFANKEDYDNILEHASEVTFGTCQVYIKPSKTRPANEEEATVPKSTDTDVVTIVEDRKGTDGLTDEVTKTKEDSIKMEEASFTEDVGVEAVKNDVSNETASSVNEDKILEDVIEDKTADDDKTAQEKEDNFLNNMLDGAIVLDSVGDDDEELMLTENPDGQVNVNIDLDESVILADDDIVMQEPANDAADKTIDGAADKTKDSGADETKDGGADKTIDGAADKTIDGTTDKTIDAQETQDNSAGVTTRRSTRRNN